MTLDQAMAYAQSHGARLATKDEVIAAGQRGFETCLAGWYNNPTSFSPIIAGIGYYVTADGSGQNSTPGEWYGWNPGTNNNRRGSAYCVGPLPQGASAAEINKYMFL